MKNRMARPCSGPIPPPCAAPDRDLATGDFSTMPGMDNKPELRQRWCGCEVRTKAYHRDAPRGNLAKFHPSGNPPDRPIPRDGRSAPCAGGGWGPRRCHPCEGDTLRREVPATRRPTLPDRPQESAVTPSTIGRGCFRNSDLDPGQGLGYPARPETPLVAAGKDVATMTTAIAPHATTRQVAREPASSQSLSAWKFTATRPARPRA